MKLSRGFTLIELMVVIAIVGIIVAIALPSFNEQVRKSRRSDAIEALSGIALKQERWRSNHTSYGTLANIEVTSPTASGYYTLAAVALASGNCPSGVAISANNSWSFRATPAGAQTGDSKCATMTITNTCGTISKTSTGGGQCW